MCPAVGGACEGPGKLCSEMVVRFVMDVASRGIFNAVERVISYEDDLSQFEIRDWTRR